LDCTQAVVPLLRTGKSASDVKETLMPRQHKPVARVGRRRSRDPSPLDGAARPVTAALAALAEAGIGVGGAP
jgi:hypothetical protein